MWWGLGQWKRDRQTDRHGENESTGNALKQFNTLCYSLIQLCTSGFLLVVRIWELRRPSAGSHEKSVALSLSFKLGVIYLHAKPAARNFAFIISAYLNYSTSARARACVCVCVSLCISVSVSLSVTVSVCLSLSPLPTSWCLS